MRRSTTAGTINLDPLTDIMANTVGIMLFVLIFGVLTARGSFVSKHLPAGHSTQKERVMYFCAGGELRRFDEGALEDQLFKLAGEHTYDTFPQWVKRLKAARAKSDGLVMRADVRSSEGTSFDGFSIVRTRELTYLALHVEPEPGSVGDDVVALAAGGSLFQRQLANLDKNRQWILFLVDVDGIDLFRLAREVAREYGFDTGWEPDQVSWPLKIQLIPEPSQRPAYLADVGHIVQN